MLIMINNGAYTWSNKMKVKLNLSDLLFTIESNAN